MAPETCLTGNTNVGQGIAHNLIANEHRSARLLLHTSAAPGPTKMLTTTHFVSLAVATCLFFSQPSLAIPPNKVCCDKANDKEACMRYNHTVRDFDNCIGGYGVDCEGVVILRPLYLIKPKSNHNGTVSLITSVGSILHDLCCLQHPKGAFCAKPNYPFMETFNLFGNADNECACLMEWRKGVSNLLSRRTWISSYETADFSANLTIMPNVQRKSWLPKAMSGDEYTETASTWDIVERADTARLCAPEGTQLDCPKADPGCKLGRCGGLGGCRACASGCSARARRRWTGGHGGKKATARASAGDSDYCCSGKFKEIKNGILGGSYGVCA